MLFSTMCPYLLTILAFNIFLQIFLEWKNHSNRLICVRRGAFTEMRDSISVIVAICFALFSSVGNLDVFDRYGWLGFSVSFIIWFVLYQCMFISLVQITSKLKIYSQFAYKDYYVWGIVTFVVLLVVDGIFLLAFYPGAMYYDTFVQMCQVTGGFAYSNHHAWLHTLMMKFAYELGL